jgi:hypothetical protein
MHACRETKKKKEGQPVSVESSEIDYFSFILPIAHVTLSFSSGRLCTLYFFTITDTPNQRVSEEIFDKNR